MSSRKSYSIDFKLRVTKRLHELNENISATAKEFAVDRRQVRQWRVQEADMKRLSSERKKADDTLRRRRRLTYKSKAKYPDVEARLLDWVKEKREEGILVHGKAVRAKAKELVAEVYPDDNFKASNGWLVRFLRRNKLVSRRVTTVGQRIPGNAQDIAGKFLLDVQGIIAAETLEPAFVGNMDETPFWFDLTSDETYDFQGVKTIKSKLLAMKSLDSLLF